MRTIGLCLVALLASACAGELRQPESVAGESKSQDADHDDHDHEDDEVASPVAGASGDVSRVLVLQTTKLERPAEVVGVVDAHESMGRHDAALTTLKRRAAALGADAVVGVEFHHGEGEGEPTHLSGLAVRFLPGSPFALRSR